MMELERGQLIMGCWVVPSIAAELWGVPLATVLDAIGQGRLNSRVESGFTLVDTDPRGMHLLPPRLPKDQRPPTFTPIVTPEEMKALLDDTPPTTLPMADDASAFDWQRARRQVARTRRPAMAA